MLQQNSITPTLHSSIYKIRNHAQQMKCLISELLDFRKFDQNHIHLKLSECNINSFLEDVYLSFTAYAQQKGIVYSFNPSIKNINIWMDDWQMRKVFFNLLSNAFKHTPANGQISLSVVSTPEYVIAMVKDSGNGIRQEDLEHIFDRFYQADNQHRISSYVGTGIGLALTKGIIELHHGIIEVESVLNEGSCFTVKLPKDKARFEGDTDVSFIEHVDTEPAMSEETLPDETFLEKITTPMETLFEKEEKKRHKILLVEDNPDLLNVLKEIFSPLYQIVTATNGEEGLQKNNGGSPRFNCQ